MDHAMKLILINRLIGMKLYSDYHNDKNYCNQKLCCFMICKEGFVAKGLPVFLLKLDDLVLDFAKCSLDSEVLYL